MWKQLLVLCTIVAVTLAALAHGPLYPVPEKFKGQEGCYIPDLDAMIPLGKRTPARNRCMAYRCSEKSITYETCGVVVAVPPCKVTQDLSKPYPNCCPGIVC